MILAEALIRAGKVNKADYDRAMAEKRQEEAKAREAERKVTAERRAKEKAEQERTESIRELAAQVAESITGDDVKRQLGRIRYNPHVRKGRSNGS